MEFQANFITNDTIKDKATAAFGLNQKSVFDIVRREAYATEAEYIKALADVSEAMQKPEYQRAARKAAEEQQQIDAKAGEMARRDLAAGRIFASGLGAKIEEYAGQLTDSAKDSKASAQQFNAFIRREMNCATVNGG